MDILKPYIIEQFAFLSGLSIEQASSYPELLENAIYELSEMLKPNIDTQKNSFCLSYLCGALLCYKYAASSLINEPNSIRVGDISVSNKNALENAKRIKEEAIISARKLLNDDGFFFGRTI